ncbi:MAG: DUF1674 domain-containing protein [Gammaproteobacteria bacterium]|nr:DUF1674 domain-containing protein [Gammaproteobacteria bacterium]
MTSDSSHQRPQSQPPAPASAVEADKPREMNGPRGPEPTRYGDWERNGRCIDF